MWIPFQFLNFRYVPANMQVLAVNAGCLVWNVIMCFLSHENHNSDNNSDNVLEPQCKQTIKHAVEELETTDSVKALPK